MKKTAYAAMLLLSACAAGSNISLAAENLEEFTLDTMVVTAARVQENDLKSASAVEVFDEKSIASSGAGNVFSFLENALGVTAFAPGINGMSMGSFTSSVQLRGVDKGTLVLVDGVTLNMDGKYNLEDIPTDIVERIEIVRGGGAVLYGSEATGGVINIITKKNFNRNKIKMEAGSFAKNHYAAQLSAGRLNAVFSYARHGRVNNYADIAGQHYDYLRGTAKSALWSYKFDEAWTLTQNFSQNEHRVLANGGGRILSGSVYKDTANNFTLHYTKDGWKAFAAYAAQEKNYDSLNYLQGIYVNTSKYSWRKGKNMELDVQKSYELPHDDSLLIGANYKRENLRLYSGARSLTDSEYQRNVYSLYASYGWQLAQKTKLNFNARETWAEDTHGRQNNLLTGIATRHDNASIHKFTPEVQLVHELSEHSSLYAKAGKSLRLPSLTQLYGTGALLPVLSLRPESGVHYELGYKEDNERDFWRIALFKYALKDAISYKSGDSLLGTVEYDNKNIKNAGIELSYKVKHDEVWNSQLAAAWSNPRLGGSALDDSNWYDVLSKYQLQGSVNYTQAKFSAQLAANFLGGRIAKNSSRTKIKPLLLTDLHLAYHPQAAHNIYLHINNLLDRNNLDNAGAAGGRAISYYGLGRNFMLGYEYGF